MNIDLNQTAIDYFDIVRPKDNNICCAISSKEEKLKVFTSGKDGIFAQGIPIGETFIKDDKFKVKLYSDPNQLQFVKVQIINLKDNITD